MTNNSQISLIDDLLNVSRIERGKMEFLFEDVDVAKVVDEVVNELIPQAATNKIKIIYHKYQGKLPMIVADPEKIQQAINNVIDNAIKYTKKGSVTVRVAKKRGSIEISVTDTGKGMEQEDLEKIFEKYGRGKDAASHAAGLGLGLYVCRVILDHHHGTIKALSEGEGKGSTFIISLPIHTDLRKEKIFDLAKEMAAK